jgi:hypothetical protein
MAHARVAPPAHCELLRKVAALEPIERSTPRREGDGAERQARSVAQAELNKRRAVYGTVAP